MPKYDVCHVSTLGRTFDSAVASLSSCPSPDSKTILLDQFFRQQGDTVCQYGDQRTAPRRTPGEIVLSFSGQIQYVL